MTNNKPTLEPKSPREDVARREHQAAVKRALIELPAFGLTLLAAQVRPPSAETGYANYQLPTPPPEAAFTLKGALRLEMMNSKNPLLQKYRRLFGSNTKAQDLSAWRSRIYVEVAPDGKTAAAMARAMLLPTTGPERTPFLAQVGRATGGVALLQVDEVFLDEGRNFLLSDLLRAFLQNDSRLLRYIADLRVLPVWKAEVKA